MEGTDVYSYLDGNELHDHTYYGNGCPNSWGADGNGGSKTSCLSRLVSTYDGENQYIGVYYQFQAATAGTGGAIATQNANSSDTFCPLGWQLPYNGTGGDYYDKSRSWRYLLDTYVIGGNQEAQNKSSSYPISLILVGGYRWTLGRLYQMGTHADYLSATIASSYNNYRLALYPGNISRTGYDNKPNGAALRCVKFLASHHRRHGGRNEYKFSRLQYRTQPHLLWKRLQK